MKGRCVFALCLFACSSESPSNNDGTDASNDATADVIQQEAGNDAGTDAVTQEAGDDAGTDAVTQEAGDDAGTDAVTQDSGDDAATACNALLNVGTVIQQMFVASEPVAGEGGVIANGTYVLTAAVAYSGPGGGTGPTGTTFQDTLAMNAGSYERVASIVNAAGLDGGPFHQNGTYELDASSLHITQTCPPGAQPFNSYSSDGTKLRIFAPAAGPGKPGFMFEYTKQ